jgi:NAD(P) transhydrogenase subunit alpha
MLIGVTREREANENRTAMTPDSAKRLVTKGIDVMVESGCGQLAGFPDEAYVEAGAAIEQDRTNVLAAADVLLRVRKPDTDDLSHMKKGLVHVSYLDPYKEGDLIRALQGAGISAISMEMVPRTTRAQKMDVLSSQASLAGYVMTLLAATRLDSILPMMMTPAGTISPARVFVIGAGVAGLQAIATAKRLGARVQAFDTRPVVAEQVQSLGAKFLDIDLGETGETEDGYARELTPEQLQMQQDQMAAAVAQADIVITTAQVFGRPAPRIITREMVVAMRPGSVIVDMAVDSGGNVEGSEPDAEVNVNGVIIVGVANLPSRVARDASQMYASNLENLVAEYWDEEAGEFSLNLEDEIIKGCLVTHAGEIANSNIKDILT